ncbi:MAG: hypothetical protein II937_09490 [Bacteroidales bacterium]|nr:hypothetical protein [Bacteroidales bacterium]
MTFFIGFNMLKDSKTNIAATNKRITSHTEVQKTFSFHTGRDNDGDIYLTKMSGETIKHGNRTYTERYRLNVQQDTMQGIMSICLYLTQHELNVLQKLITNIQK